MAATAPIQRSTGRMVWIHSTRLHVVLYSMLLVATPFVILRRFLQEAIGHLSRRSITVARTEVLVVPAVAVVLVAVLVVLLRAHLTRLRTAACFVALAMVVLGQQVADYYFSHRFYDLQHNWHYVAYAGFAFMMSRDLIPRGVPLARIILLTFLSALLFSSFDEVVQLKISRRVFDMSDIAKDAWGSLIGLNLLYLGENRAGALLENWRPLRHHRILDYFSHPFSLLVLLVVFTFFLLSIGSLLTDHAYVGTVVLLASGSFALFLLILHLSQYRWGARSLIGILLLGLLVESYFVLKHRSDQIVSSRPGLVVYKGIPIPLFDLLIHQDGTFRLVDKKAHFNVRDRLFLMRRKVDVILIGAGPNGTGGRGFPEEGINQFNYNKFLERGTQIIILRTSEACAVFNRLKRERKNVLFVLHTTG